MSSNSNNTNPLTWFGAITATICLALTLTFLIHSLKKIPKDTSYIIILPALLVIFGYAFVIISIAILEWLTIFSSKHYYPIYYYQSQRQHGRIIPSLILLFIYIFYIIARLCLYILWVSRIHVSFRGTVFDYSSGLKFFVLLAAMFGNTVLTVGILFHYILFDSHYHQHSFRFQVFGAGVLCLYYLGDSFMQIFVLLTFTKKMFYIADKVRQQVRSSTDGKSGKMLSASSLEFIQVACKFITLGIVCIMIDIAQVIWYLCYFFTNTEDSSILLSIDSCLISLTVYLSWKFSQEWYEQSCFSACHKPIDRTIIRNIKFVRNITEPQDAETDSDADVVIVAADTNVGIQSEVTIADGLVGLDGINNEELIADLVMNRTNTVKSLPNDDLTSKPEDGTQQKSPEQKSRESSSTLAKMPRLSTEMRDLFKVLHDQSNNVRTGSHHSSRSGVLRSGSFDTDDILNGKGIIQKKPQIQSQTTVSIATTVGTVEFHRRELELVDKRSEGPRIFRARTQIQLEDQEAELENVDKIIDFFANGLLFHRDTMNSMTYRASIKPTKIDLPLEALNAKYT